MQTRLQNEEAQEQRSHFDFGVEFLDLVNILHQWDYRC